jgi:hypothetical protein
MQSGTVLANLYSSDDSVMEVNDYNFVRFYVLTVVIMKMAVFWDVVPCKISKVKQSLCTPWRRLGGEEV